MLTLTFPIETPLHRLPAALKCAGVAVGTAAVFGVTSFTVMGLLLALLLGAYLMMGRLFAYSGARALRPLWPFCTIMLLWHFHDFHQGFLVCARMIFAVGLANLMTMTTTLTAMMALFETLLRPLRYIGLKPQYCSMALMMVIRFTPVLLHHGADLAEAWRARSASRPKIQIALPILLVAMDEAEHLAEALRARGGI